MLWVDFILQGNLLLDISYDMPLGIHYQRLLNFQIPLSSTKSPLPDKDIPPKHWLGWKNLSWHPQVTSFWWMETCTQPLQYLDLNSLAYGFSQPEWSTYDRHCKCHHFWFLWLTIYCCYLDTDVVICPYFEICFI